MNRTLEDHLVEMKEGIHILKVVQRVLEVDDITDEAAALDVVCTKISEGLKALNAAGVSSQTSLREIQKAS